MRLPDVFFRTGTMPSNPTLSPSDTDLYSTLFLVFPLYVFATTVLVCALQIHYKYNSSTIAVKQIPVGYSGNWSTIFQHEFSMGRWIQSSRQSFLNELLEKLPYCNLTLEIWGWELSVYKSHIIFFGFHLLNRDIAWN